MNAGIRKRIAAASTFICLNKAAALAAELEPWPHFAPASVLGGIEGPEVPGRFRALS